jgi:hypothetical protein
MLVSPIWCSRMVPTAMAEAVDLVAALVILVRRGRRLVARCISYRTWTRIAFLDVDVGDAASLAAPPRSAQCASLQGRLTVWTKRAFLFQTRAN